MQGGGNVVRGAGTVELEDDVEYELEPEENEQMVARIAKQANYIVRAERRFEPDGQRAGGYAAILEPATESEVSG